MTPYTSLFSITIQCTNNFSPFYVQPGNETYLLYLSPIPMQPGNETYLLYLSLIPMQPGNETESMQQFY